MANSTRQTAAVTCQVIKDLLKNTEFIELLNNAISNAIDKKMDEVLSRLEIMQGDIFDLQNKLEIKDQEINNLKHSMKCREEEFRGLQFAIDKLEQYSRGCNIRIFGIPEKTGENTDSLVADIVSRNLGISFEAKKDIERSHRVGRINQPSINHSHSATGSSTEDESGPDRRPRGIIVKLSSHRKRREILLNRRKLKGSGISIVEDLTMKKQILLNKARKIPAVNSAWSSEGRIIVSLMSSGGKSLQKLIANDEDLKKLNRPFTNT
ncbi:protein unc-13 homolog C-like [Lytechinus variegatus]|uniref:protein unc-13 homolog C-like n=1 Tax=Lytechinus variegatus TaxID=7654 RepID=UPI001BB0F684|nr:protein unc-13 homolog C-like [Lytechinus variegatus]